MQVPYQCVEERAQLLYFPSYEYLITVLGKELRRTDTYHTINHMTLSHMQNRATV